MSLADIDLDALSVASVRAALARGDFSVAELVQSHLDRIERFDGSINSIIETNPDALEIARQLDAEQRRGDALGALHGVPILLKDNIETSDRMMTTAGSLALEGHHARRDADVVRRLREAGAVILGKTNLAEWANFRSRYSTNGWSSRGGLTRNPYALDRTAGGSSSGSAAATAAAFSVAAIGTETDGSVVSPAALNGVVGVKPTVGLVSAQGIVPISPVQDTAGVMARRVEDTAAVLSAIAGKAPDYAAAVAGATLSGTRIGVARTMSLFHPAMEVILDESIRALGEAGAEIVDVTVVSAASVRDLEYECLVTEYRHALGAYLAALPPEMPVRSIEALIAFNDANHERVMPHFGQDLLVRALAAGSLEDESYRAMRDECSRRMREEGIDRLMSEQRLGAIVVISTSPAWLIDLLTGDGPRYTSAYLAAIPGHPNVTVPAGYVHDLPIGLSFMGGAWQEAKLLALASAFERVTAVRRPPKVAHSAEMESGPGAKKDASEEAA